MDALTNSAAPVAGQAASNNLTQFAGIWPPRVAVVIGCHDQAAYVKSAIRSVAAQSYENFECVVLDDSSTDKSADRISEVLESLSDPRFQAILRRENGGQMVTMLDGLDATSSPFAAFLDADDLWHPAFLERHVLAHMSSRGIAAVSCSNLAVVDADGTSTLRREAQFLQHRSPTAAPAAPGHGRGPRLRNAPLHCAGNHRRMDLVRYLRDGVPTHGPGDISVPPDRSNCAFAQTSTSPGAPTCSAGPFASKEAWAAIGCMAKTASRETRCLVPELRSARRPKTSSLPLRTSWSGACATRRSNCVRRCHGTMSRACCSNLSVQRVPSRWRLPMRAPGCCLRACCSRALRERVSRRSGAG